jgi:class 3 adenylate cyclase
MAISLGDGVNIAARLEALALAGGGPARKPILISAGAV